MEIYTGRVTVRRTTDKWLVLTTYCLVTLTLTLTLIYSGIRKD